MLGLGTHCVVFFNSQDRRQQQAGRRQDKERGSEGPVSICIAGHPQKAQPGVGRAQLGGYAAAPLGAVGGENNL